MSFFLPGTRFEAGGRVAVEDLAPLDPVRKSVVAGVDDARQEDGLVQIGRNVVLLHHSAGGGINNTRERMRFS